MSAATCTTEPFISRATADGKVARVYKFTCLTTDLGAVAINVTGNGTLAETGYIDSVITVLGTSTSADVSITAVVTGKDGTTFNMTGIGAATGITASGVPKDGLRYVPNAVLKVLVANGGNARTLTVYVVVIC